KIKTNEGESKGVILDINRKGCRCHINKIEYKSLQPMDIDIKNTLLFPFPGIEGELEIRGLTRNIQRDGDGVDLGIVFSQNQAAIHDKISQYILSVYDFI
ncbi:MAG: PilZ domain-containing protein, partial [Deltaproteobacteria bacterium]|nr:PilZ domain-containing protein [Deltaproteobacteria bacterium]